MDRDDVGLGYQLIEVLDEADADGPNSGFHVVSPVSLTFGDHRHPE